MTSIVAADAALGLTEPPRALVEDGRYRFGTYDAPIPVVNPLDVASRVPRAVRNLRLKEWQAFQLGNDDWFVLGAVYTTKVLALVQVIAVHRASATAHRWESKVAPTAVHIAQGLDATRSHGRARGFEVVVDNAFAQGEIRVRATHRGGLHEPALDLRAVARCGRGEAGHLVICHPFAEDRALYSNKVMMPANATLRMGATEVVFDEASSFMILDDHKGEYPAPMAYDWVTGARRDAAGFVGFNLTDNQVRDPDRYNENALFLGTTVHRLPAVHVERPDGIDERWTIRDADGQVDVGFTPMVPNSQRIGPGGRLATYDGPFGWFDGTITPAGGRPVSVDGLFGMGERKRIRF